VADAPLHFVLGPAGVWAQAPGARAALARLFTARMGAEVIVDVVAGYDELFDRIRNGQGHFAWLPPVLVVDALDQLGVTLLVSAVRAEGPRYHGALFVPREHPARTVEAVRGRRVAWVDRRSASGYLFARLALIDRGLPADFFAAEDFLGSHRAVVAAVRDGRADVGATYVHFPEDQHRVAVGSGWHEIGFDAMRVLLLSDVIPSDGVCAAKYVDAATRIRMTELLCTFDVQDEGRRALREVFDARSLEPTLPQRYLTVRRALALASSPAPT
jgi:phosphonate transport system substrate-binding protein